MRDDCARTLECICPRRIAGGLREDVAGRERVGLQQVERAELAGGERLGDRARAQAVVIGRTQARCGVRQHAGLAQPATVRARRDFEQPGAVGLAERQRLGQLEQRTRAGGAVGACGEALAPDDHELLAGLACQPRRALAQRIEIVAAEALELEAVTAHALAQAQVEDRCVVQRLAVEQQHGVRELEVGDLRLQTRLGQRASELERQPAAGARVDVRRAETLAQQPREEQALLVGRAAAGERRGLRAGASQRDAGLLERALPGDRAQLAAVAQQRLAQPHADTDAVRVLLGLGDRRRDDGLLAGGRRLEHRARPRRCPAARRR